MDILEQFGYTEESIIEEVDSMVRDEHKKPLFYAISGSHLYGFPSEDSDLDVRGFHVSDKGWDSLDEPEEQVHPGQDAPGELDVVSYEVKKFGQLLLKGNFNVIELIFNAPVIYQSEDAGINNIRMRTREHLPMDLPKHYRGMAKQNYHKYLDPTRDSYTPNAKKFLYVLRGLLAARYVTNRDNVTADIHALKEEHNDGWIVDDLINWKRGMGDELVSRELEASARMVADDMIYGDDGRFEPGYDREAWKQDINEWMGLVREQ